MANTYLAARWIEEALDRYHNRPPRATIMGKRVIFSNFHYLAALLHIYTGTFKLTQIAEIARLPREELDFHREQLDFMTLVDYLKTRFSEWFRETIMMRDFSLEEYADIAWEYTKLDEMVQSQIKIPLLERLKHLYQACETCQRLEKPMDTYDLNVFRRLMSFFILTETIKPTLSSKLIKDKALPVAEKTLDMAPFKEWQKGSWQEDERVLALIEEIKARTNPFL
ncbi:hypothetical protein Thein_0952 [Thermodesulfatator indicus DSM 15286]|uniref:Uncharacterized protein n=1 Tax=Thermodesulfatator indicus (strain DSM 15286 / JCM 11887 / CIR29812) TaxID=667014 RepID=F8AD92_THEID|nr:hypothetical protein [Thermodesulfatator indicus]AEH44826.1 hypothetical protein Thein_0952 [Thermodesulfatator indicus DSM 15286]